MLFASHLDFKNIKTKEQLYITQHTLIGKGSTLFKDCIIPKVVVAELPRKTGITQIPSGLFDFVNCNLKPIDFQINGMEKGSRIRVQNLDGTCFQIDDKGIVSSIQAFLNI